MKASELAGRVVVVCMVLMVLTGGCGPDPKERIKMLEDNNQSLTNELSRLQNDAAQLRGERDACRQDLATARGEASTLRGQLAAQPQSDVPEGWTAVPGGAMIAIEGWALFASGKTAIQKGSKRILDIVVDTLQRRYPQKDVLVFGHTDNIPIKVSGWHDNWELSSQRALSVVRYMASCGVSPKRLVACGCGEFRPLFLNDSSKHRQKNRRVEIFVLDPQPRTGIK
ncbi:MAG: OmpA family protein [Phycisphaerae bacterium]|nr:OmpA family protein [Phycisphaerae bacterium]